ncbi:gluconokinase [Tersicoccus solisilvae]|uniref:Gluconokinase n=1 Tax=Tersicoccus solisilvae TaxID=1882339 RepID=A0ABQ1P922_9MICC|nr:gluconokinase [Tersicoccus solisilvae]GGC93351.1 gluconokinase [Tersicoccus solisilvae]
MSDAAGHASSSAPLVVVMGVSGSGKTTIGALIADELGVPFVDGDGLHPIENVRKMAAGTPLTDEDRWPWLRRVGEHLASAGTSGQGLVVACSALKRAYRDTILAEAPGTVYVHLAGTVEVLQERMEGRSDHFMPPSLLRSQLATLEPLAPGEPGFVLDIAQPVDGLVRQAVAGIRARD